MSTDTRIPLIVNYYEQFLVDQEREAFVALVSDRYCVAPLERLAEWGDRVTRRAAVLALGFIGDYSSNHVLGRALVDNDRGVRTLADNGIRNLWRRVGSTMTQDQVERAMRLIANREFEQAIALTTQLIHEFPWFAEAWNQRALGHFNCGRYEESIRDCHQALEINPYHFPAATGMGKCYLQLGNRVAALEAFRRALRLNPSLDDVRAHVVFLQRALKEE